MGKDTELSPKGLYYQPPVTNKQLEWENADLKEQIEQAKEIIRKMLFALSDNRASFLTNPYYDLEKQAEQFIKETEQ